MSCRTNSSDETWGEVSHEFERNGSFSSSEDIEEEGAASAW